MKKIEKTIEFGGKKLTLTTGNLANQADASVLASYGETVVLATVVSASTDQNLGYFPLYVEYGERLYAGGRIKGSRWVKREGRPSDEEILISRLIDRSIRPLFPENYKKEVQIIITLLSVDLENTPDVIATIATSASLSLSPIPWQGPTGTVRVGLQDEKFITNPTEKERETSNMDLLVTASKDAVIMIEAGANQIPEEKVLEGISFAQKEITKLIDFIKDFISQAASGKEVLEEEKKDTSLEKRVKELVGEKIKELIKTTSIKKTGQAEYDELKRALLDQFEEGERGLTAKIFDNLFKYEVRKVILTGKRPDGRGPEEIREVSAEVAVLPRTHGSAVFQRGQTQALTVTTLGPPSLEQFIESAEGEETKRFIHHYSMPPYSVGETGRVGWPSRREIGHGALAEKALIQVIPEKEVFPYTIRVVSEVLSSNGSTSMAATCGSTLSLMDAGVPIKSPISGIAMGLVIESDKKFVILSDITGLEDGNGDMDFKVAGSEKGITALQLDVKTLGLTLPVLKKALAEAKDGRAKILKAMLAVLDKPRGKVSTHAPKIKLLKVSQDKIGEIIGPGGRTIRSIIAETGAQIDVEDDGTVSVSGITDVEVDSAVKIIESLVKEAKVGEIYEGVVKRIQQFGAFVEILPGKDGLVHVSDMDKGFVKSPQDLVKIGDKVKVRVKEIDELGRINLSMILDPAQEPEKGERWQRDNNKRQRYSEKFEKRNYKDRGRDTRGQGGPHFPTSRYLDDKKKDFNR